MTLNNSELEKAMHRQAIALGAYVLKIRNQQGISQVKLAKAMGVSRSTLRRLESGDASVGFDTCLMALLALGIEQNILFSEAPLHQPLPTIPAKQKITFAKKLQDAGIHPRMAKNAAWLLAFSPEKRAKILSRAVQKWQRTSLQKIQSLLQAIELQYGRVMLMGDAAMFLYGKPNRELNYEFWVRIAQDELVEIVTAFGFDIDSNRTGQLVAYDGNRMLNFLLSKRMYHQDQGLIEYDVVEAKAKVVSFEGKKLLVPNIQDLLKLKTRAVDAKGLEDVAYLEGLLAVDV